MTESMISSTKSPRSDLIEIKPGVKYSKALLKELLPDVETALFFGKVFELDYTQLSLLLSQVLNSDLANELFGGDHSVSLQDYLLDGYDEDGVWHEGIVPPTQRGNVTFAPVVPKGEILPELWKQLEVTVAASIKDVAAKLHDVVGMMPGKQGNMVFKSMMVMNRQRPGTIGDHKAQIEHGRVKENLLILDDSGSVTDTTIRAIIEDVVALSYMANAHLAVVSNTTRHWDPGTYDVGAVLAEGQYGGTHYETLSDLLDRDWGVVVTVADYDSSMSAKHALARCVGHIDQVIDVSLVNRPTFLAECVGQLADDVRPVLVAQGSHPSQLH